MSDGELDSTVSCLLRNENVESAATDLDEGQMEAKTDLDEGQMEPVLFNNADNNQFHLLHPDDPLMQRFQDALKAHLTRIDNKLSEELHDYKQKLKSIQREREDGGFKTRSLELEILNQRKAIQNYENLFEDAKASREQCQQELDKSKQEHKRKLEHLKSVQQKELELSKKLEQLTLEDKYYANLEEEISSEVAVSKRISEKDVQMQRELLREKKKKDYLLYKLEEEKWKIDHERNELKSQLEVRQGNKWEIGQAICDINVELEELQKELKSVLKNMNLVLLGIKQRDEVNLEQGERCREMLTSLVSLQTEIDNIKKESVEEMERNRRLTELKMKLDEEISSVLKESSSQREVTDQLEQEFAEWSNVKETWYKSYNEVLKKLRFLKRNEVELDRKLEVCIQKKNELEEQILTKLNETMMGNAAIRKLNKEIQETKQKTREYEFLFAQVEKECCKNLEEMRKISSVIEDKKFNLEELAQVHVEREKKVEKTELDVRKYQGSIGVKETKIWSLKKKIEEILHSTKGQEMNLLELKIATLEKSIEDADLKNRQFQKQWLRLQSHLAELREKRNVQFVELTLITKQIMIIEQKNFKLEYELGKQNKEQANVERKINEMRQLLVLKNGRLAARRDFKQYLEDVNLAVQNESIVSLEEAERELMTLQMEIRDIVNGKENLKNILYDVQQESLSWEKKVQLACEASKIFKEERKGGGDIAGMKSEIHKMEMKLSQLKKVQQKFIQDMELCIVKRENILERVAAEEKRNPKNEHNRRIIIQKRLDAQRLKIKQMNKEFRLMEDEIMKVEDSQRMVREKMTEAQQNLRETERDVSHLDHQIAEAETQKNLNLEILIRKQRKATMLQNVTKGKYKKSCKSEAAIEEQTKRQTAINEDLKEILLQTKSDFPQLEREIDRILTSLEV